MVENEGRVSYDPNIQSPIEGYTHPIYQDNRNISSFDRLSDSTKDLIAELVMQGFSRDDGGSGLVETFIYISDGANIAFEDVNASFLDLFNYGKGTIRKSKIMYRYELDIDEPTA